MPSLSFISCNFICENKMLTLTQTGAICDIAILTTMFSFSSKSSK